MTLTLNSTYKISNGLEMPYLGFGTAGLKKEIGINAIKWAIETGYRHIDTASYYKNEIEIGEVINNSKVDREDLFVVTKLFPGEFDTPRKAFEDSLKRLKLDYVDLYLIHWPSGNRNQWLNVWKILIEIYNEGFSKSIGVSSFDGDEIDFLYNETQIMPMVNQIEMHPFIYQQSKNLLDYCKSNNIFVTAYSPIVEGSKLNDKSLIQIAENYNKSTAQLLLRWCLEHNFSTIPKSKTQSRIIENKDVFDFKISEEDMTLLNNQSDDRSPIWRSKDYT